MTSFYVAGGALAAWALIVTALGILVRDFPKSRLQERAVSAVSVLLVGAAIGTAVVTAESPEEPVGEAAAAEAHGDESQGEDEAAPPPATEAAPAEEPAAGEEPAEAAEPLRIAAAADGALAYDTDELEASPGRVTIEMANPSPLPHNVAIDGGGVDEKGEVVPEGGTSTVSAQLEPGIYSFYCSVPGHREGGMEGRLVVR